MNLVPAFIALGANLREPEEQVRSAFEALGMLPKTRLAAMSSLYRSAPVGYLDQPDFINAVAKIETALPARALLEELVGIEKRYGRIRDFPNAPRTLDLDILLYGDMEIDEPGLSVPHPRMHERAFVLVPLAEIAPDQMIPGHGRARDLVGLVETASLTRLDAPEC